MSVQAVSQINYLDINQIDAGIYKYIYNSK